MTITVKPDDGYELDDLTVTDKDGDSIKLKDKGDGRFTFTMPASKVTVEAVFTALEQEEEQPLFSDVAEDDWYYDAVAYVAENGIMSGTDGSRFSPNGTLTRAMLSQILYAMEDKPAATTRRPTSPSGARTPLSPARPHRRRWPPAHGTPMR